MEGKEGPYDCPLPQATKGTTFFSISFYLYAHLVGSVRYTSATKRHIFKTRQHAFNLRNRFLPVNILMTLFSVLFSVP